jgi:predicted phage terminase large subunit-like protein
MPDLQSIAQRAPLSHPAVASIRLFDYSFAPGEHLQETYHAIWKAVDEDHPTAPTHIARLMPRGHGKTESNSVVVPTWLILSRPDVRVAIISKTRGLAAERTEKVVEHVERFAPDAGVEVAESGRTQLTTGANDHKEPTISPYGLESQLTGKHFDVIIYDDIGDWDNQRTETQRRNVRQYFRDYVDNLAAKDSVLESPVQVVIGTRKHPQDIYATDVLDSPRWQTRVYRAIAEGDWGVVESRDWTIRGADGETYDSVADLPPDVPLARHGVEPNADIDVLWPELQPPEALLSDIVGGDHSTAVWRRENQQDARALAGEVFKSEWLVYDDDLPNPRSAYRWVAGLDLGLVDDPQAAAEGDTDYTALAVVADDPESETAYLTELRRERGLSVQEIADWTARNIPADVAVEKLLVEQNAGRGPGQRLRDNTTIPTENVSSTTNKEARIHNLSADFQSGRLRIVGDESAETWRSFEQDEWLQFPTAAHDDRLDAIELAMRAVDTGGVATARASFGNDADLGAEAPGDDTTWGDVLPGVDR